MPSSIGEPSPEACGYSPIELSTLVLAESRAGAAPTRCFGAKARKDRGCPGADPEQQLHPRSLCCHQPACACACACAVPYASPNHSTLTAEEVDYHYHDGDDHPQHRTSSPFRPSHPRSFDAIHHRDRDSSPRPTNNASPPIRDFYDVAEARGPQALPLELPVVTLSLLTPLSASPGLAGCPSEDWLRRVPGH